MEEEWSGMIMVTGIEEGKGRSFDGCWTASMQMLSWKSHMHTDALAL